MSTYSLYIQTIGCQMNVYDSERMAGLLSPLGFSPVRSPETADMVIVNTCAIRAKAEQKVFSYLGRLAGIKRRRPHLIIAVGGCVAQQEGAKIRQRVPAVDLVFGTHAIGRLPRHVAEIKKQGGPIVDVAMHPVIEDTAVPAACNARDGAVSRFVTIMQGCDNFCTYCVVPYVRGREASRRPERIVQEIRDLVGTGVREVTLLGQNVNSYGVKEGRCPFPELLERVHDVQGLHRIRFTTSHPKDLSDRLIRSFGALEKLCHHIHLPVQSGANRVLHRMNRGYTKERYLEKIGRLRDVCPDIAVTSDFIVGFPGETASDFQHTLDLMETVGFDGVFAFMYSDRPNAPASRFSGKISETEKSERLQALLELQEGITARKNRSLVGTVQAVLVEGLNQRPMDRATDLPHGMAAVQWSGRTSGNKIVHLTPNGAAGENCPIARGALIDVRIDRALSHSLLGQPVDTPPRSVAAKGEYYAA